MGSDQSTLKGGMRMWVIGSSLYLHERCCGVEYQRCTRLNPQNDHCNVHATKRHSRDYRVDRLVDPQGAKKAPSKLWQANLGRFLYIVSRF